MCNCTIPQLSVVRGQPATLVTIQQDCPEHGRSALPALWRDAPYKHSTTREFTSTVWYGYDRIYCCCPTPSGNHYGL